MIPKDTLDQWIKELEGDSVPEKTIKDLTISEFKSLIREIISEEIAKHSFVHPVPMQPYYYEPVYPWDDRNKVWCDTKTTMKDISNINYKEKM